MWCSWQTVSAPSGRKQGIVPYRDRASHPLSGWSWLYTLYWPILSKSVQCYFDKSNRSVHLRLQYFYRGNEVNEILRISQKYLLAGIYIIFVLFTCCNSRFYHTPLAKICSVTEKQTLSREGTRGSKEYYYTQNITARILNGSHKGEK